MSIELGTTDINGVYLGDTEINEIYLGDTLVYDKPATITYLQSATDINNLTTFTFSSQNFGDADSERYIAVTCAQRGANGLASVTIGGVSATITVQITNALNTAAIAIAKVPTGTSGDIVVTWATAGATSAGISVYRITNLQTITAFDTASSISDDPSVTLDIDDDGVALGLSFFQAGTGTIDWTGLTEDYEGVIATTIYNSTASDYFATGETGRAISTANSGALRPASVYASWS